MKWRSVISVLICAAALPMPAFAASPDDVQPGTEQFSTEVLATGLEGPWEITWGPDDFLWITERAGKRVTRVNPEDGSMKPAITIEDVAVLGPQDGLLGMALHPELLQGSGNDYVYVAYTYLTEEGTEVETTEPETQYPFLRTKLVRLTYDAESETLGDPMDLITGMPASNDHNSGRLKFGPDGKLYYTIGDQGNNQLGNFCRPIEAQRLPTQEEVDAEEWPAYVGKSLRLNLDGSIPEDNPTLDGVKSHVFTYGHRNPQGLQFGPDGNLYSSEHGPKSDDEANLLVGGKNYGWPFVAGFIDDMAYSYAQWAESSTPCAELTFSETEIPESVPVQKESDFQHPDFMPPLETFFTVPSDYNFQDPACGGVDFICWPTIAPSSVDVYAPEQEVIPGWSNSLVFTTLKRGSIYRMKLGADGTSLERPIYRYFQSENRFRDLAFSPDNTTIYVVTDNQGIAEKIGGGTTTEMENPGAIMVFTYAGEGEQPTEEEQPPAEDAQQPADDAQQPAGEAPAAEDEDAQAAPPAGEAQEPGDGAEAAGVPPTFTVAQAERGKTSYNSNCAVCHGNTLTNGTMGPPLAGQYFREQWSGRTVAELYEYASTNMPPTDPGALPKETYADIIAYVLQVNGFPPGEEELKPDNEQLASMVIQPPPAR